MYSKIYTGAISGIDSLIATVEVDVSTGMPTFEMVGLLILVLRYRPKESR